VKTDDGRGPAGEYTRRLGARRDAARRLARGERRISNMRLIVFLAAVAMALVAFDTGIVSPWWVVAPLALFAALVVLHDRVITARRRADRAVAFYERGLARLEDRWMGHGEAGERFLDAAHPYAADLDLFGRGSLFELLCTARTRAGEDTLAAWLCAPAPPDVVCARQAAVAELTAQLDLREDLALLGDDVRAGLDADTLAAWGTAPPVLLSPGARIASAVLVGLAGVALIAWPLSGVGPLPLLAVLAVEAAFALRLRRRVLHVIHAAQHPDRELVLFAELLARLEGARFTSPRLVTLRAALDTDGEPPSRSIARLHRLVHLLDARKNELFAPLAALLL